MSSPPPPFSIFLSSCPPFLLFDRAAGFFPPRPRIVAGRRAQILSRLAALQRPHPPGTPAFTAIERDGRFDGSGRLHSCLLFIRLRSSARYSDGGCFFGRPCYEVHGACDNRINLYPAAPIRLAKVLLAWTIAQEGWGSSFERQIGKCQFAIRFYSHTSDLPDTRDWGVGTQRTVDVIA